MAAHAEQYFNPPGLHPSEPNYLWLEAGTNFGVRNDGLPSANHQSSTQHLVNQLEAAGLTWKAYAEGIERHGLPGDELGKYAPKHVPFVFFDDVTHYRPGRCIAHVRPYSELAGDLAAGAVADYNFITPNLCDDMHDSSGCKSSNAIRNGDDWLASASAARSWPRPRTRRRRAVHHLGRERGRRSADRDARPLALREGRLCEPGPLHAQLDCCGRCRRSSASRRCSATPRTQPTCPISLSAFRDVT